MFINKRYLGLDFSELAFSIFASFMLLCSWLAPNHGAPWLGFCQDVASFFGFLLLGYCVRGAISITLFECFFVFMAFIPIAQWLGGVIWFRGDAVICFFYIFVFALSICVGRNLVGRLGGSEEVLVFFFSLVLFAAIVSVWFSLRQWLRFDSVLWVVDLRPGGRPFANFAQPNNYASFLLLAMAGVGYLFDRGRLGGVVSFFIALFLLFGVALSQSRTPFVVGVFAVAWSFLAKGKIKLSYWSVGLFFSIYLGFFVAIPSLSEWLNIPASNLLDRVGALERLGLWAQMWGAIKDGPFWGYGWGQVSVAQTSAALLYPGVPITEYSHNVVLDILVWNGLVPGFFLLAVTCYFLINLASRSGSSEALFCLLAVGFLSIHSLLEFPFAYAFFLFPVGLLLGVLESEVKFRSVFSIKIKYMYGLFFVSIIVLFIFVLEYLRVEEDYRLMRFESAGIGSVIHDEVAPEVIFMDQVSGYIRFARTPATQGMSDDDLDFMRKISHRYPYSSSIFRYALALGLNGRASEAAHEMLILRSIYGDESYGEGVVALNEMESRYPRLGELIGRLPKL